MPPRQPSISSPSSPISLSSWPVTKYSYSASSLSSSIQQPPWTHFAHRDNVFLVINTQRVRGYIQQDGKFSDHQTRLKIVWGLETLESLDLTSLAQQITPPRDLQQPNKPAFVALGRSPSLAIRYFRAEDQTVCSLFGFGPRSLPMEFKNEKSADNCAYELQIRRFQIKLLSDAAYYAVVALLEQAKCSIGIPPISRDETRYDLPSQAQIPPHFNSVLAQHIPLGTSSSTSSVAPGEPHSSNNSFSYLGNASPIQTHDLVTSATTSATTVSRDFREPPRAPQTPSHSNISYPYLPNVTEPSDSFLEDIPPPRPPPFGPRKPLDSPPTYGIMPNTVTSISDLPPLPRPTPLKGPPPSTRELSMTSPLDREAPKYREPNFGSPGPGLGADTFHRGDPSTPKKRTGAYRPGLPGIVEEHPKGSSNDRGLFPVFPHGYKKPGAEPCALAISNLRQGMLTSITTASAGDTNTGGKRKQNGDEKEGQEQQKKPRVVLVQDENPHTCGEDEFRQIEDFIVNAIHDDDFLKLVERIGCVWQRMGFDDVGVHFFGNNDG